MLVAEPSTLRVTYHAAKEGKALIRSRLKAISALITKEWKARKASYRLPIETRVIGEE